MKLHPPKRHVAQLLASILLVAFVQSASAQVTFLQDSFTTLDTNTWTRANTGTATSFVTNGSLILDARETGASQRATLISKATNFNPFLTQKITMTFSNLSITGTNGSGANGFYAFLGNTTGGVGTGNNYYPGGASSSNASYLAVQINQRTNSPFTQLVFDDRGATASSGALSLSATPTSFIWEINGTNNTYTITLTGATFTNTGLSTRTATFSNFTSLGLSSGSYLAIGGINSSIVTSKTIASLDDILVTAAVIPEPSTVALLTIAGVTGLVMLNRRRRGSK